MRPIPPPATAMQVAVIGTGRVGLISCVAFAAMGHQVVGTDADARKLELLKRGRAPFHEPGLQEALARELAAGRLRFVPQLRDAVADAGIVFICVGTPARDDGEANLVEVERAVRDIARHASDGAIVVAKSTVPAGTADTVRRILTRDGVGRSLEVASNPEFLREGLALHDALEPDRIVVGVDSARSREALERLYQPLIDRGVPFIVTDTPSAELAKHASNAFLALKISFANGLARLCERAGADVDVVTDVMGADPRIGRAFLDAGLGYGGYCLPKDVAALSRLASRLGYPFPLLDEIERLNGEAIGAVVHRVEEAVWNVDGKRIAVLGLAFKPGTDDVRSSPALALVRTLWSMGAIVTGYDPRAGKAAAGEVPELIVCDDPYTAARGADCVVVATDWTEFRDLDLVRLRDEMAQPIVVDGRNLLDDGALADAGFWLYPIGRRARVETPGRRSDVFADIALEEV